MNCKREPLCTVDEPFACGKGIARFSIDTIRAKYTKVYSRTKRTSEQLQSHLQPIVDSRRHSNI